MPIFLGDFFDPQNKWRIAFPTKFPFEDSVRDYIAANPQHTLEQCSKSLGISVGAVAAACESIVAKGDATWDDGEDSLEEARRNVSD